MSRKVSGDAARELARQLTGTHLFFRSDGGMASGLAGDKFCTFTDDSLAHDAEMPKLSRTITIYDSPEELAFDLNDRGVAAVIHNRGWAIRPLGEATRSGSAEDMGGHILAASARWASSIAEQGTDLASLREGHFEIGLCDELNAFRRTVRQVPLKGNASRDPVLKGWPGPGGLDIEISSNNGPVWAELKWAKGAGTLSNCLWDAAKVACAVRDGVAATGYLVAGAPLSEWEKDVDYADLFNFSGFSGDSIFNRSERFARCWHGWCLENKKTYPLKVATPICTWPEGQVVVPNGQGEPWAIRVSKVTAPGDDMVDAPTCFGGP